MISSACFTSSNSVSPAAVLSTGTRAGSVDSSKSFLSYISKTYHTIITYVTCQWWPTIMMPIYLYIMTYVKKKQGSTWDSAIVRTMGRIIGCITIFRSSAQRGGSTCVEHNESSVSKTFTDGSPSPSSCWWVS